MIYSPRKSDILIIDGEEFEMSGKPFDSYLKGIDDDAIVKDYVAKWQIIEGSVYLQDITIDKYKHLIDSQKPVENFIGEMVVYLNNDSSKYTLLDGCLYRFVIHHHSILVSGYELETIQLFCIDKSDEFLGEEYQVINETANKKFLLFTTWEEDISSILNKTRLVNK